MHIFYGELSSHNRTSLDVACQGNLTMRPTDFIKIIEDMRFNPYNNSRDKRIMKRAINQMENEATTSRLRQQIQALSKQIETLMKA